MSSLRVLGGAARSIWEPALIGISELCAANEKPIGALFEQENNAARNYRHVVRDELLEPFWETFFSSILVKVAKVIAPAIPEQIVIIPSKLAGAAWHWKVASLQSINKENSSGQGNNSNGFLASFYRTVVKKPTEYFLGLCGVREQKPNFLKYALSQLGIFSLSSVALKYAPQENLPGVNIDSDESIGKSILKSFGYGLVEEATYAISHTMRYYFDFKGKDFGEDRLAWAKALTNVANEKLVPGHMLSALSACLSTFYLGKKLPKTTAALLGEFPMKIFSRMINCRRRRATKYKVEHEIDQKTEKVKSSWYPVNDGKKIPNYRFHNSPLFNKFLNICDFVFNPFRIALRKCAALVFDVKDEELEKSITINLENKEQVKSLATLQCVHTPVTISAQQSPPCPH